MKVKRMYTQEGVDPLSMFEWEKKDFTLYSDYGNNKMILKNIEVPKHFTPNAQKILISKYTRLTEVPKFSERVPEKTHDGRDIPDWLQRRRPTYKAYLVIKRYKELQEEIAKVKHSGNDKKLNALYEEFSKKNEQMDQYFGHETSAKQMFTRIAGFYTYWGWYYNYFDTEQDAKSFYDEILYSLAAQLFAPNTPTWFNAGLYWAYGIKGAKRGFWKADPLTGEVYQTKNTFKYPGVFACFVFEVMDTLFSKDQNGIYDIMTQMVKAYTYGGGVGINWSSIRSKYEKFSNGNNASGSHPFMLTADRSASNILSGASQRRAANIFIKDIDDPEIEEFIDWKKNEEKKVEALGKAGYSTAFGGEAYETVSGQSVNTTVRITREFIDAVNKNKDWSMTARTTGEVVKTLKAKYIWDKIIDAAYESGDPGLQFDDIIQSWNTLLETGKNKASNPCIAGDSLLITKNGLKKIKDIKEDYVELLNPDGKFKKYKIIVNKVKPIYRVTLKSGHSVEITDDHPMYDKKTKSYFTIRDWLKLDNNKRSKVQPTIITPNIKWNKPKTLKFNDQECTILGFLFGNGNYDTKKKSVKIKTEDKDIMSSIYKYLSKRKSSEYQTEIYSEKFTKLWDDFKISHKGNLNLPDTIYELTSDQLRAFLKGLYSTNGSLLYTKVPKILLKSRNRQVVSVIQKLLSVFGIYSSITKDETQLFDDEYYNLIISSILGLRRFYEKIGFIQPYRMKIIYKILRDIKEIPDPMITDESSQIDTVEYVKDDLVYDFQLREEGEPAAWVDGLQLHNCGEFLPNGSAACNLASININKFIDENDNIDTDKYLHEIRLVTIALDIVNNSGQVPSKLVAQGVYDYRYIGLGLTGIAKAMMKLGMVYGGKRSMDFAATIYSLMTAQSYLTSAELARQLGSFPQYKYNKNSMWSVINNHYKASVGGSDDEYMMYDGKPLPVKPYEITTGYNEQTKKKLHSLWKKVMKCSKSKGFRNASVTLLQPSGTLTFILDAGTYAAEPVFSLISTKIMTDGTTMKIIPDFIIDTLKKLGYSDKDINDIMKYFLGRRTLDGAPYFNRTLLEEYQFTDDDIKMIEKRLVAADRLVDAVDTSLLSPITKSKLGIKNGNINIFKRLGLSKEQYIDADKWICGANTFEGAPHIKQEHIAIFDTAVISGYGSTRFVEPRMHINISSAIQPFISHAISKTINLPNWITKEEISKLYKMAYEKGCKSITIYRDGCKKIQPLINMIDLDWWNIGEKKKQYMRGERKKPPQRRQLIAHNIKIKTPAGDKEVIIKFGEYEDGSLAEIYIETPEENQEFNLAMNWLGRALSKLIQFGAPIDEIYDSYINKQGAQLKGRIDHPYIASCTSIVDLVVRIMNLEYKGDTTYCKHKPPISDIRIGKYVVPDHKSGANITSIFTQDAMINIDLNSTTCYKCGNKITPKPGCYTCPYCGTEYGSCSVN